MQFKLTGLMWLTAYFAVGAWLYSWGIQWGLLIWLGTVFGWEIGSRTDYSRILLAMCGFVLGLAVLMAVFLTADLILHPKFYILLNFPRVLLTVVPWMVVGVIFTWLVTRLKNQPSKLTTKISIQSPPRNQADPLS